MNPSPSPAPTPPGFWDGIAAWSQTNLGAGIIAGLVVVFLAWLASVIFARVKKIGYRELWVRFGKWVRDTWPVMRRTRDRQVKKADTDAYKRRSDEIDRERKAAKQPYWEVDPRDRFGNGSMLLTDSGFGATDVRITSNDPELCVIVNGGQHFDHFINGGVGSTTGRQFDAALTERGRREGASFHVTWLDANGDLHEQDVILTPESILNAQELENNDYFVRGVIEGRKQLQNELDEARTKPVKKPRWVIVQDQDESTSNNWLVANMAEGATALHVSVDAPRGELVFLSAADWPDMTGKSQQTFSGYLTSHGESYGVTFTVEWTDANGDRRNEKVDWEPIG